MVLANVLAFQFLVRYPALQSCYAVQHTSRRIIQTAAPATRYENLESFASGQPAADARLSHKWLIEDPTYTNVYLGVQKLRKLFYMDSFRLASRPAVSSERCRRLRPDLFLLTE